MAFNEKKQSPEKQLLNIIEKPASGSYVQSAAIKYNSVSLFSVDALKSRWKFLLKRFKLFSGGQGRQQLDLKFVNQALGISAGLLTVYLVTYLVYCILSLNKDIRLDIKPVEVSSTDSQKSVSILKAGSFYLEKARERDIFRMNIKKSALDKGMFTQGPSEKAKEISGRLKLVGISWSSDPDAMVEDSKSQKTYFLKKGQLIDNEIRVEGIFKDKVLLSFEGEEIELR